MSAFITVLTALALATSALAATAVSADASCPVKGAEGDYSYDPTSGTGPADWGSIKPDYEACGTGKIQSPIDFPTSVLYAPLEDGPKPMLEASDFIFSAGSYNWALTCATDQTCGFTMFGGKKFYFLNQHFHAPSEHTLNGKQYPFESHMVHISEDGDLAVIATMFEFANESEYPPTIYAGNNLDFGVNSYIKQILNGVTKDKGTFKISPSKIIDSRKGYCVYTGSLTTPPCSEGVTFLMAMNVETVSKRQVHEYYVTAGAPFDGNNRPVQPLNGRKITCYV